MYALCVCSIVPQQNSRENDAWNIGVMLSLLVGVVLCCSLGRGGGHTEDRALRPLHLEHHDWWSHAGRSVLMQRCLRWSMAGDGQSLVNR